MHSMHLTTGVVTIGKGRVRFDKRRHDTVDPFLRKKKKSCFAKLNRCQVALLPARACCCFLPAVIMHVCMRTAACTLHHVCLRFMLALMVYATSFLICSILLSSPSAPHLSLYAPSSAHGSVKTGTDALQPGTAYSAFFQHVDKGQVQPDLVCRFFVSRHVYSLLKLYMLPLPAIVIILRQNRRCFPLLDVTIVFSRG